MDINSVINIASGSEVGYTLLKKSQDIAAREAAQLLKALPKAPSLSGMGGNLDIRA